MLARKQSKSLVREESGQSLPILIGAMTVILAVCAFAIDAGGWMVHHHKAQITADSAALAAASCLENPGATNLNVSGQAVPNCSSSSDTSDAQNIAIVYAGANGVTITGSNVAFDTSQGTVTVSATVHSGGAFASLFGLGSTSQSARATAAYQEAVPYSLFAGSSGCGTNVDGSTNNDGLTFVGNGGGQMTISGAHTNGLITDSGNSGSEGLTGTYTTGCSADRPDRNASPQLSPISTTIPYPVTYTAPGAGGPACTSSASSFTDAQITSGTTANPNIYCATGTCNGSVQSAKNAPATVPTSGTAGSITLNHAVTNVELYANCVVLSSGANGSSSPTGQPLVYGSETDTTTANNNGTNSTVFFTSNNLTLTGAIYVPTGTVEFTFNNDIITFVEAENIVIDKNNAGSGTSSISGNGPTGNVPTDQLIQ
jgi:hypothetical protein